MTVYEEELMNNQSGVIPTLEKQKERMQDDVIKKYGFEAPETTMFCMVCADTTTKPQYRTLQNCYDGLMM